MVCKIKLENIKNSRIRILDLFRGLAVILMVIRHIISGLQSNFSSYTGLNFLHHLGGFAPILFFTSVGISFYFSSSGKNPKKNFIQKLLSGISLIAMQELFLTPDFQFENSFWVLTFIGSSLILLGLLFLFNIKKPHIYLYLGIFLTLIQPFELTFANILTSWISPRISGPIYWYLMNAIFYSGWSFFHNLSFPLYGVYLGYWIKEVHRKNSVFIIRKSIVINTVLFIICLFLFDIEPNAYLWFLTHAPYTISNHLLLIIFINYVIILFSLWEVINNNNFDKINKNNLINNSKNKFLQILNIQHLFSLYFFEIFGIFAFQIFILHGFFIISEINFISPPFGLYCYIFIFFIFLYIILNIYLNSLKKTLFIKKLNNILYKLRWIFFIFGVSLAVILFTSRLLLILNYISRTIFEFDYLSCLIILGLLCLLYSVRNLGREIKK
jgi:hypothetical protein